MAEILNYIIISIILVIGYLFLKKQENITSAKSAKLDDLYVEEDYSYMDDVFNRIPTKNTNNLKYKSTKIDKSVQIHPYFIDMRVHNDYRDTITAFNDIAPDQRPIFNRSVLPVKQIDVDPQTVKPLVKAFIKRVNESVKYNVTETINKQSGWDELAEERKSEQTGWDKQMSELGIPETLYNSPAKRAKIKLIKIDTVEKFVTEDQINFIVHMICQKKNTEDQMIVKISYIMDNVNTNADRTFNNKNVDPEYNVRIEEIYIIGFLTNYQYGDTSDRKDYYQFTNIEKDDMIDQELLLKTLKDKYKQRQIESDGFNISIPPSQTDDVAMFRLSSETPYKPVGCDGTY